MSDVFTVLAALATIITCFYTIFPAVAKALKIKRVLGLTIPEQDSNVHEIGIAILCFVDAALWALGGTIWVAIALAISGVLIAIAVRIPPKTQQ